MCRKGKLLIVNGLFSNGLIRLLIITLFLSFQFGCSPTTKLTSYFRTLDRDTLIAALVTDDMEMKIQAGDALAINVSSLSKEEDYYFNAAAISVEVISEKGTGNEAYMVDKDGQIQFHKLGKVKVVGLTRRQLQEKLQRELLPYLKDPLVTVRFSNHKVTIIGDVARPQLLTMPEERLAIPELLALCGDLNITARRDNILIIREEGNEKRIKRISLEDQSIFNSPWYYIVPNDIVYISTDDEKRIKDEKRERFYTNFALITSSFSLLIIIIDRLIP